MPDDSALRRHLLELLQGGQAHITLEDTLKGFPVDRAGERPSGSPHSAWELLEHMRIAQEDIVAFSGGMAKKMPHDTEAPEGYTKLKWPDDYWPSSPAPKSAAEWNKSVRALQADLERFLRLLNDPERNLVEPFPWGSGQTLLREALLIADHNAYHLGQLLLVRKMLEAR